MEWREEGAAGEGHSKETKARHYEKVSYEEVQESLGSHHPAFVEGGVRNHQYKLFTHHISQ